MRVVVLGGSGFIGSAVCRELIQQGHVVRCLDLRLPDEGRAIPMVEYKICDILNLADLIVLTAGFEVVFNFAGLSDLNVGRDNPRDAVLLNVLGNVNALEACRQNGISEFIYASSIYVFGKSGGFYRCSKQSAEIFIDEYRKKYGVRCKILRYGSLYGPNSDDSNGLYRIIHSALRTGKVSYRGSSDAMRQYIHVDDAAKATVSIMMLEATHQTFTITGQEPMRVLDLLETIREILQIQSPVDFQEDSDEGHYVRTPYNYVPEASTKYVLRCHKDLAEGVLELIRDVATSM